MTYDSVSTSLFVLAQQAAPAGQAPAPSIWGQLLMIGLLVAGFYFLVIMPQRKKQKEHDKMISELKNGDEILTVGGIYGTVTHVKNDRIVLRIADNVRIDVSKTAVASKTEGEKVEEKK